ncbi:hypothetical protein MTO96_006750 [Rhipicephalus appendiculatus]
MLPLALEDVEVLRKSRTACQLSATLGERALTQNADGRRFGKTSSRRPKTTVREGDRGQKTNKRMLMV